MKLFRPLALSLLLASTAYANQSTTQSPSAQSEASWVESYLTLQEPEIVAGPIEELDFSSPLAIVSECEDKSFSTPMAVGPVSDVPFVSELGVIEVALDKIINIGAKVWNIVQSNAPVVKINMPSAFALPSGSQCWTDLENWQPPRSQIFHVKYRNMLWMDVVNFSYRIIYTHGGSYNGAGSYLANVSVHPATVDVAWGFSFDADVSVGDLMNLGSKAEPEAGMELAIKWKVNTPLNSTQKTENFFIRGNGDITQL